MPPARLQNVEWCDQQLQHIGVPFIIIMQQHPQSIMAIMALQHC
jgi:hypothetical protein